MVLPQWENKPSGAWKSTLILESVGGISTRLFGLTLAGYSHVLKVSVFSDREKVCLPTRLSKLNTQVYM